ncbi:MAG: type transport system ATP-binding protein [Actinomycetota bacterium]|nr:type transport system ATP-binding protein [Actinomycetota bacterium]
MFGAVVQTAGRKPDDIAVRVENVSKRFRLYHERNQSLKAAMLRGGRAKYDEFWALKDVSLEVPTASTFGLIGQNGSGKSTLLKCIARILRPDAGSITVNGKVSALLELGAGFHQELSGRENVYLNGSILGLARKQIDAKFDEIVDFAGLEKFIDTPVKNYSSGMYVRLGFSVAINVDPDVLLVDEVLAVGDENFQRKCAEKFADLRDAGKTIVVVSHGLDIVRTMCERAAWLEYGVLKDSGTPAELIDKYVETTHIDRTATASGGSRWGSGEIAVTSVQLLDADGEPTLWVHTGQPATLRFNYVAREPVVRPVLGFGIHSIDGVHATGVNSRDTLVPETVEGPGHFDFVMSRMPLTPGSYDVTVAIVDHSNLHTFDFQTKAVRFDVGRGVPNEVEGVFAIEGTWKFE